MLKLLKTYIPMLMSLLFFIIYMSLIRIIGFASNIPASLNSYFIIGIVVVVLFLVQWVCFIIQAARNKELKNSAIWAVLIYFFNVFIIPYYNFKYVAKVNKLKLNMILYIVLGFISCIVGFTVPNIIMKNSGLKTLYLQSNGNEVQLVLEGYYEKRKVGEYEFYASDYYRNINVGGFVYDSEDNTTAEDIQSYRKNWIYSARENVGLIDSYTNELEDRIIISDTYRGSTDGSEFVYKISTVSFKDSTYMVNLIQVVFSKNYLEHKEEFNIILEKIELINT